MRNLNKRLFSINVNDKEKIIRILGLKFKKKRKPKKINSLILDNRKPTLFENIYVINDYEKALTCTSQLCNQEFFGLPFFQYWARRLKNDIVLHRKLWEYVYITQTLHENDCLRPGKKGLAFGVGKEPLPALYASLGCKILATDLSLVNDRAQDWANSDQHAANNLHVLNERKICPENVFIQNVAYRDADMNHIPSDIKGFDFNWSSCSLEHLGGMDRSFDFLVNCLDTLKPGGLAVHTTEFNLSSNDKTSTDPYCCIFREKDIRAMVDKLNRLGHYVYPLDLRQGTYIADNYIDVPPYNANKVHLRLKLGEFVSTSIGLIIRKKK